MNSFISIGNKIAKKVSHAFCFRTCLPSLTSKRSFSNDETPQGFDHAEKAKIYREYFEQGEAMWLKFVELAKARQPNPSRILDLGSGPGEPGCTLASFFKCPAVISDLAPPMVELSKKRIEAKGLDTNQVKAMQLDISDLSKLSDNSFDLVTASHCFQFCPEKSKAAKEIFRVLKPNGVLIAAVWNELSLISLAGQIMSEVTNTPPSSPPFNPNGPLGLREAAVFDKILTEAGFKLTNQHNMNDEWPKISLGPLEGDNGFKVAMLPLWDILTELETSGKIPDAWERARVAWTKVATPLADQDGIVNFSGTMRFAIVSKP